MQARDTSNWFRRSVLCALAGLFLSVTVSFAQPGRPALSPTNIFAPVSTPAKSIFGLSLFGLGITAAHLTQQVAHRGLARPVLLGL
jgi:hypothetical protein